MAHAQKPDFVFPRNGRVPFKSVGASVQSTTGSRGVRISSSNGSNAGQTTFRGKAELYWLPTPLACFPFTSPPCVTVCHQVPNELYYSDAVENLKFIMQDNIFTEHKNYLYLE